MSHWVSAHNQSRAHRVNLPGLARAHQCTPGPWTLGGGRASSDLYLGMAALYGGQIVWRPERVGARLGNPCNSSARGGFDGEVNDFRDG